MFSFVVGEKKIDGKEYPLIACCEEDDPAVLDGARLSIERMAVLNGWTMVGFVCVGSVMESGNISKTDGCAQAAALAEKLRGERSEHSMS